MKAGNDIVESVVSLPMVPTRDKICALENAIQSLPKEQQRGFENLHDFCPGVYARTVFMPANSVLTSKIHKTSHFFVVSMGRCTVVDSHGNKLEISAPYMGMTTPGTKRALHIHEDCIWTTFHATDLTDVAEIERQILAESFEAFDAEVSQ